MSLRSVLQTMRDEAKADIMDQPGRSGSLSTADVKAMFAELLDGAKQDILAQVKGPIDQVYMDFESVEVESENAQPDTEVNSEDNPDSAVAGQIDEFIQPKKPVSDEGINNDSFKSLAEEFSVTEKTSPAIDANLAEIVKSLLNEKLPKEKLSEVQAKYLRPEICTNLVAPKINKQIWQQLRQETRNTDSAFQKPQSLLISGLYVVLQRCNSSSGEQKNALTHTAVLLLSANRDLNLKRRDLSRPDLNKQYPSLCNPSTTMSTFLFGDDLNKEVEELTKSNKLRNKVTPKQRMEPYEVPDGRGMRGRGCVSLIPGRGRDSRSTSSFLVRGWAKHGPIKAPSHRQPRPCRIP